jgi:hypothetical protein
MKLGLHIIMGGPETSEIEAYTTLGFIAARTRGVRLLTLVTAASYRHAGLLAKMVTRGANCPPVVRTRLAPASMLCQTDPRVTCCGRRAT